MTDFHAHAEELIREYRERRGLVISKRRKLLADSEAERVEKLAKYDKGLRYMAEELISALNVYVEVFNQTLPQLLSNIQIKSKYPDDLDISISLKNHSLRFISRLANQGEVMHGLLVDGMMYCESTYKGENRMLEAQAGLFSDIGNDAWGNMDQEGKFIYFLHDTLPELIKTIWHSSTLSFVHSREE